MVTVLLVRLTVRGMSDYRSVRSPHEIVVTGLYKTYSTIKV